MTMPRRPQKRLKPPNTRKLEYSTLAIVDRMLAQPHAITFNGEPQKVATIEAIILQLQQKAIAGNGRAWRALLKYQEFADRHVERKQKVVFVESDYTRAFKKAGRRANG